MSGKHRLRKRKRRRRGNPAAQMAVEAQSIAKADPLLVPPLPPSLPDVARVRARFKLLQRSPDVR